MENDTVMAVAGVILFAVSFLLGCWYTHWKSGMKRERDYALLLRQFRNSERDDEYKLLKQKFTEEFQNFKQNEHDLIARRRLYAVKISKEKENRAFICSLGLMLPTVIFYTVLTAAVVPPGYDRYLLFGGIFICFLFLCYIIHKERRWLGFLKTVCIMEDILKEFSNGIPPKKQETLNLDEMNQLVNTLKPAKKEQSISSLF